MALDGQQSMIEHWLLAVCGEHMVVDTWWLSHPACQSAFREVGGCHMVVDTQFLAFCDWHMVVDGQSL